MRRFGRSSTAESPDTPAPRPSFVLMDGPAVAAQFEVPAGESYVGRQQGLELVLDSHLVSRIHAKLRNQEGRVTVEDLRSRNGTWVGNERVEGETELHAGDAVRFGNLTLIYTLLAPDEADAEGGSGGAGHRRWWVDLSKGAKTAVLTAGALAAAVSAVVALWPDPDREDAARVNAVHVLETRVPLSKYQSRPPILTPADAAGAPGGRSDVRPLAIVLASAHQAGDAPSSDGPTSTGPTSSSPSPTDSTSSDPSPTGSTSATQPSPALSAEVYESIQDIAGLVSSAPDDFYFPTPDAPPTTQVRSVTFQPETGLAAAAATNAEGDLVDEQLAAERVVTLLRQIRTTPVTTPEGVQKDPVGALVDVDLELSGLRDQTVSLSWQVRRTGKAEPLYGQWMRRVEAHRLTPSTEHDTASVTDMWVPLPKQPGRYVIVAQLSLGDSVLARGLSEPFS